MDYEIGSIVNGNLIGAQSNNKYIKIECVDCGKEDWVKLIKHKPKSIRCTACTFRITQIKIARRLAGNPCTETETGIIESEYRIVTIPKSSKFYPMANSKGIVKEHRLIMATHLDRCLTQDEAVRHINKEKQDNRIENLEIGTPHKHKKEQRSTSVKKRYEKMTNEDKKRSIHTDFKIMMDEIDNQMLKLVDIVKQVDRTDLTSTNTNELAIIYATIDTALNAISEGMMLLENQRNKK